MTEMDIRTLDELVMHQIGCRQDITALLYQIRSCKDQLQDPSTTSAQVAVLQDRQSRYIDMVAQRQDDVKQLAHIQRTLAPARSRDAWMDYLASMVSPTAAQQVQEVSPDDLEDTIRAIGACGCSRIDFLLDNQTGELFANEINTIPGSLAFYLWEKSGLTFSQLMDEMIRLALKRQRQQSLLHRSFETNLLQHAQIGGAKAGKKV